MQYQNSNTSKSRFNIILSDIFLNKDILWDDSIISQQEELIKILAYKNNKFYWLNFNFNEKNILNQFSIITKENQNKFKEFIKKNIYISKNEKETKELLKFIRTFEEKEKFEKILSIVKQCFI
jgi:hypothetical protein